MYRQGKCLLFLNMKVVAVLFILLMLTSTFGEECPDNCKCSKYKIFCRDSTIKDLPNGLTSTIQLLSMDGDVLFQLNNSVFNRSSLTGLTTLAFINMHLQEIHAFTFRNVGKLESLIITKNYITDLQPRAFLGLEQLYTLDLSDNKLRNLKAGVFEGLESLRHLNLSFNWIKYIDSKVFDGLRRTTRRGENITPSILDLSENNFTEIHDGAFQGLSYFTQLKITRLACSYEGDSRIVVFQGLSSLRRITMNCMSWVNYNTARGLYNLTHFHIWYSYLSTIPNRCFAESQSLKRLSILRSRVQELEPGCFHGLSSLSELNLSGNYLTRLLNSMFEDLASLTKLNLKKNYIIAIEENTFKELSRLKFLDLSVNRLHSLERNTFSNLELLRELILSRNNLLNIDTNEFKRINSQTFSGLFSLKRLQLSYPPQVDSNNVTLATLQRLDSFEGPGYFTSECIQVMRTLKLICSGVLPASHVKKWLAQIRYFRDSIQLEINGLSVLKNLNSLSEFHISSLDIKNSHVNTIEIDSFIGLPKLTSLTVHTNSKLIIQLESFKTLKILESIKLYSPEITIQQGAINNLQSLKSLELYSSVITIQREAVSNLPSLVSLELHSSEITIQQAAFNDLHSLEHLKLYSKVGFQLELGVFKKLSNLKRFVIEATSWKEEDGLSLRPNLFNGLRGIKELTLEKCGLQVLGTGNFLELENLQIFNLKFNLISNISQGAFRGLRNIQKLDLSWNSISSINAGVFGALCNDNFTITCAKLTRISKFCNDTFALSTVRHLDLSNNRIAFIRPNAFIGCNKLHILILSWNKIQTLDFLFLPQLTVLHICGNSFSEILNTTFGCSTMLSNIDFKFARIESMYLSAFEHLKNLKTIVLPETICDCRIREIWQWLRSRSIQYMLCYYGDCRDCNGEHIDNYFSKLECNNSYRSNFPSNKNSDSNDYHYFKLYIEPIIFIFIFLSGCFGNGLLLFVIFRHSDMRNMKNACVVHLALADIFSLVLNLPLSYWDVVHINWDLGETTCKIFIMSKELVVALVVFSVVSLSLERFLIVRTSFKLKSSCGFSARPIFFLIIVWIGALINSIPSYINANVHGRCFSSPPHKDDHVQWAWTFQLVMYCLLPVVFIVFLNIVTAYNIKKSVRNVPGEIRNELRDKNRNTVANIVMILSFVFMLSYIPSFLLRTLVSWSVWENEDVFWYSFVTYCLFFFHTVFNPFALLSMGSKYKAHILEYIKFFIEEKEKVSECIDVKEAFRDVGVFLAKLGEHFMGIEYKNDNATLCFYDDITTQDDIVRRARQERINKLQLRYLK